MFSNMHLVEGPILERSGVTVDLEEDRRECSGSRLGVEVELVGYGESTNTLAE